MKRPVCETKKVKTEHFKELGKSATNITIILSTNQHLGWCKLLAIKLYPKDGGENQYKRNKKPTMQVCGYLGARIRKRFTSFKEGPKVQGY